MRDSVSWGPNRPAVYLGDWLRLGATDRGMELVHQLAAGGAPLGGGDGFRATGGRPRRGRRYPSLEDLVFIPAQLDRLPLLEDEPVDTTVALGTRAGACHRGTCPVGIATQTAELRMQLDPQISARRLHTFLTAATVMISDYCRITGRRRVGDLGFSDLATTFFTTDHYAGHPVVLVRMNAVDADELTELISDSWALRAPRSLTKRWALERDRDLP